MDKLLGTFTNNHINNLTYDDLLDLEKLLDIDDNNLYNFYNNLKTDMKFENNKTNLYLKTLNIIKIDMAERLGFEPKGLPLRSFKTGAFNRSAISPCKKAFIIKNI